MIQWRKRRSPIAIDVGSRALKLIQLDGDDDVIECVRWERSTDSEQPLHEELARALEGRQFRGREATVCLNQEQLIIQNVRVPKAHSEPRDELIYKELAGRLPCDPSEMEFRFVEAADVRQGEATMREIIVFGCERRILHGFLEEFHQAGIRPNSVDVEPMALLRCYARQFRRTDDSQHRALYAHVGYSRTRVIIAEGDDLLFVKYIDLGGKDLDTAVARQFQLDDASANSMRRNNGDRRSSGQDIEIAQSVARAVRPVVTNLGREIAMCIRYNNVTFRGTPISRIVIGGGEATSQVNEGLSKVLEVESVTSQPFRDYRPSVSGPAGQWDIAVGLAFRHAFEGQEVPA